jgi:hypothetical protein
MRRANKGLARVLGKKHSHCRMSTLLFLNNAMHFMQLWPRPPNWSLLCVQSLSDAAGPFTTRYEYGHHQTNLI